MKPRATLILDRKSVSALLDMKQAIKALEEVFRQQGLGRTRMPPKVYLDLPEFSGDFRAMPAYVAATGKCGLKWVNTHLSNARAGLPMVMAVVILNDPKTGFPLCVMDGTQITNVRTGAAGAVAAKYLARRDSSTVGLVGCGAQARTQLAALRQIFKVRRVKVWGKEPQLVEQHIRDQRRPGEQMSAAKNIEDCVRDCDIVVTTTPSRRPLVKRKWLSPGTHINAIGADAAGKEELEPAVLKEAKVVVDDFRQASHSGEINVPFAKGILTKKDICAELGQIICGCKKGRTSETEITVFDSTGLAIQDIAVADLVYRAALRQNLGQKINLLF